VPVAVAIGEDFGVAFIDADDAQAARPRDARRLLRHGVMDFESAAAGATPAALATNVAAAQDEPNRAGDRSATGERNREPLVRRQAERDGFDEIESSGGPTS
jgi:hypothetical protein